MRNINTLDSLSERSFTWLITWFPKLRINPNDGSPCEHVQTAFAELAWLLIILRRDKFRSNDPRLQVCIEHLADAYSYPTFHNYMLSGHPLAFAGHLLIWTSLEIFGYVPPIPRSVVQQRVCDIQQRLATRPLHLLLELKYFLSLGQFDNKMPSLESLFLSSELSRAPSIATVIYNNPYPSTHLIFYLTDFGCHHLGTLSQFYPAIQQGLESCLHDALVVHDWDIVSEVVFSLHCLGLARSKPPILSAVEALASVQDSTGAILEGPGGHFCRPVERVFKEADFLALYHRSLTCLLATLTIDSHPQKVGPQK
jgi:hypothetical protein